MFRQWQSYTLILMLAITISIFWLVIRAPKGQRAKIFDICLAGLIGGVFLGRVLHVWLNWLYFADHTSEIIRIYQQGGLNWHGVVIGALFAGLLMAQFHKVDFSLDKVALIVPILAFATWFACVTAGCAYGTAVERMSDYPRFLTWAEYDIFRLISPRFATQPLGMIWAFILLGIALFLQWRNWLENHRLWLIILLLSVGSFAISFLRGDYALYAYGLRLTQWLDIGMALFALTLLLRAYVRAQHDAPNLRN
jgi:phosphatidylglycerol---prolipoprotein diacylglyceryl transferase